MLLALLLPLQLPTPLPGRQAQRRSRRVPRLTVRSVLRLSPLRHCHAQCLSVGMVSGSGDRPHVTMPLALSLARPVLRLPSVRSSSIVEAQAVEEVESAEKA